MAARRLPNLGFRVIAVAGSSTWLEASETTLEAPDEIPEAPGVSEPMTAAEIADAASVTLSVRPDSVPITLSDAVEAASVALSVRLDSVPTTLSGTTEAALFTELAAPSVELRKGACSLPATLA